VWFAVSLELPSSISRNWQFLRRRQGLKNEQVMTTPDGDDFIGIRWMAYFALSFDHRVIVWRDAERFLAFSQRATRNRRLFRPTFPSIEHRSSTDLTGLQKNP
jgi:hypothetical protein